MKKQNLLKNLLLFGLYLISCFLCFLYFGIKNNFNNLSIEAIVFFLRNPFVKEMETFNFCFNVFILTVIFSVAFIFITNFVDIYLKRKKNAKNNSDIVFSVSFFLSILNILIFIQLFNYNLSFASFFNQQTGHFYEDNFVFYNNKNVTAPQNKKNLILIIIESMEKTFADENTFSTNLIPNLSQLSEDNISFDNFSQGYAQSWTQAAFSTLMIGAPLNYFKLNYLEHNDKTSNLNRENYDGLGVNAASLSKILKEHNYNTLFVQGGSTKFASLDKFLQVHQFDKKYVFDIKDLFLEADNHRFNAWGIEDEETYNFFEKKILKMPKDKPFFATMFTVDTHFGDEEKKDQLEVIKKADDLIKDFVDWFNKQPFSSNTTLVIIGDHLRMGKDIKKLLDMPQEKRLIYNVFINSKIKPFSKNRSFNHFDLFPTLLESIGFQIKGHHLGLGTSLFSKEKTLVEKLGNEKLTAELKKKNKIYQNLFSAF